GRGWRPRRDAEHAGIPERALADRGGVSAALASYADHVLPGLAAPERTAARRILLALVTSDGTRASRVRGELVAAADDATAVALEALVTGRLVVARDVADGPPVYELAHESLLVAWGTLRGWLDDAAGQRAMRPRRGAAAEEWQRLGQPRELLWRRSQLVEAESLEDLTAGDRAFLGASRRHARLRAGLMVAIAAAIPAAGGLTWWGVAKHQQERREQQVAEQLDRARAVMRTANATVAEARRVQADAIAQFRAATAPRAALPLPRWLWLTTALKRAQDQRRDARTRRWDQSVALFGQAGDAMRSASAMLEAALRAGALHDEVRRAMSA